MLARVELNFIASTVHTMCYIPTQKRPMGVKDRGYVFSDGENNTNESILLLANDLPE